MQALEEVSELEESVDLVKGGDEKRRETRRSCDKDDYNKTKNTGKRNNTGSAKILAKYHLLEASEHSVIDFDIEWLEEDEIEEEKRAEEEKKRSMDENGKSKKKSGRRRDPKGSPNAAVAAGALSEAHFFGDPVEQTFPIIIRNRLVRTPHSVFFNMEQYEWNWWMPDSDNSNAENETNSCLRDTSPAVLNNESAPCARASIRIILVDGEKKSGMIVDPGKEPVCFENHGIMYPFYPLVRYLGPDDPRPEAKRARAFRKIDKVYAEMAHNLRKDTEHIQGRLKRGEEILLECEQSDVIPNLESAKRFAVDAIKDTPYYQERSAFFRKEQETIERKIATLPRRKACDLNLFRVEGVQSK